MLKFVGVYLRTVRCRNLLLFSVKKVWKFEKFFKIDTGANQSNSKQKSVFVT